VNITEILVILVLVLVLAAKISLLATVNVIFRPGRIFSVRESDRVRVRILRTFIRVFIYFIIGVSQATFTKLCHILFGLPSLFTVQPI